MKQFQRVTTKADNVPAVTVMAGAVGDDAASKVSASNGASHVEIAEIDRHRGRVSRGRVR
jgi:hypothetical protein